MAGQWKMSSRLSSNRKTFDNSWKTNLGSCVESDSQESVVATKKEIPVNRRGKEKSDRKLLSEKWRRNHCLNSESTSTNIDSDTDDTSDDVVRHYPLRSRKSQIENRQQRSRRKISYVEATESSTDTDDESFSDGDQHPRRRKLKPKRKQRLAERENTASKKLPRWKKIICRKHSVDDESVCSTASTDEDSSESSSSVRMPKTRAEAKESNKYFTKRTSQKKNGGNSEGITKLLMLETCQEVGSMMGTLDKLNSSSDEDLMGTHDDTSDLSYYMASDSDCLYTPRNSPTESDESMPHLAREQFFTPPRLEKELVIRLEDVMKQTTKAPDLTAKQHCDPPTLRKETDLSLYSYSSDNSEPPCLTVEALSPPDIFQERTSPDSTNRLNCWPTIGDRNYASPPVLTPKLQVDGEFDGHSTLNTTDELLPVDEICEYQVDVSPDKACLSETIVNTQKSDQADTVDCESNSFEAALDALLGEVNSLDFQENEHFWMEGPSRLPEDGNCLCASDVKLILPSQKTVMDNTDKLPGISNEHSKCNRSRSTIMVNGKILCNFALTISQGCYAGCHTQRRFETLSERFCGTTSEDFDSESA